MQKAIKTLSNKIALLNSEIEKEEKNSDNPEMLSDYEFSINAILNIELEIIELKKAISILNKHR